MGFRAPGLRVQIVLALAGVILLAYVPLFFAIAQVTEARANLARDEATRAVGKTLALHVADLADVSSRSCSGSDDASLEAKLGALVRNSTAVEIAVYGPSGAIEARANAEAFRGDVVGTRSPQAPRARARSLEATWVSPQGHTVRVRLRHEADPALAADVIRGIALYMGLFALALLAFAYMLLTRLMVRPIEDLARAADRVAHYEIKRFVWPSRSAVTGAREIVELGASVRAMASRLLDDEKALRAKIDELTTTTRHLGETRTQLEGSERLASLGRLAAGIAHEIGNPLAAIMGMHDLLEDAQTPSETRTDFLRRMRNETERIHGVVRDLLDYARPEDLGLNAKAPALHGPTEPAKPATNVREVVDDALALVRLQADWKRYDVTVEVDRKIYVHLAPQRLTQVFLNLFLNAGAALAASSHASSHDEATNACITVRAFAQAEGTPAACIRIDVEDRGPGVASDLRERIFEPFVTTKDVGAGTGLGLAVCRGIVDGAGGRIFVDASFAAGARFVVELPGARGFQGS